MRSFFKSLGRKTSDDKIPQMVPDVVVKEVKENWGLIYHPDIGETCGINEIGMAICSMMDGQLTVEEISKELASRCKVSSEEVSEDVNAFIRDLVEAGYVIWK